MDQFSDEDLWKGLILFGLNAATYKMGLAKTLFDFSRQGKSFVAWDDLAASFLSQYEERIAMSGRPQQSNPGRLTVMERVVADLNLEKIDRSEAIARVADKGLRDVIPRFQTIGRDKNIVGDHFYNFEYGRSIELKDSLLGFSEAQFIELETEFMARWSLLEGAFSISQENFELANDIREIYLKTGYERTTLTSNISFLNGYQGNVCFYCAEPMADDIHVDHVLPRQVVNHDEIWNLVLAHGDCNLLKSDKVVGPHFVKKLIARNENIMGSNHPWKHKISEALGKAPKSRAKTLGNHYEGVKTVLGNNYWGGAESYNPATDQFYRRLITLLNNR
jgi:HNH endonuclease